MSLTELDLPALRQRGQHCAGGVGLEQLLGGPQPYGRRQGIEPDDLVGLQAMLQQPRQMRMLGRTDQDDVAAGVGNAFEARPKQTPLAQRGLRLQHFRQRAARPAAPGQFSIEQVEAGRHDVALGGRAQLVAPPHGFAGQLGEPQHIGGARNCRRCKGILRG